MESRSLNHSKAGLLIQENSTNINAFCTSVHLLGDTRNKESKQQSYICTVTDLLYYFSLSWVFLTGNDDDDNPL